MLFTFGARPAWPEPLGCRAVGADPHGGEHPPRTRAAGWWPCPTSVTRLPLARMPMS